MRDIGHFIGGRPVSGTSGTYGDVFNPASGEIAARIAMANAAEVDSAVAAASAAWPAWAATPGRAAARTRHFRPPPTHRRPCGRTGHPLCVPGFLDNRRGE